MAAPIISTGASITFSSGFLAQITSINHSGIERPAIDTSHFGTTTARTFIVGSLFDAGTLEVGLVFDPDTKMPITGAAESVTITYSDGSTWVASGFLTGFTVTAQLEERVEATATLKFTGDITVTSA